MPRNQEPSPIELVLSELRDFRSEFRQERETVGTRLATLEKDVNGAKLLGRVALGVAASLGAFATWAADIAAKVSAAVVR